MPIGVAGAVAIGGAALSAGATMYGASQQAGAVKDAQASANAAQAAAQGQLREDLHPYTAAGTNALAPAQNLLGLGGPEAGAAAMANFTASPGYQYQFDQGIRAVNAGMSANGLLGSGAQAKALQDRGNGLAAQDFGTYYNRLMGLVTQGQSSAAGVGASGVTTAAGQAQTDTSAGTAQASIYGNTSSGIGNAVNNGLNNYMYGQKTNSLYGGTGSTGGLAP